MLGFRVFLADGSQEVVESSSYEVDDLGALTFVLDGRVTASFDVGNVLSVDAVGTRLAEMWPDPRLVNLLDGLGYVLAVTYGHHLNHLGGPEKYASEAFNEVDALSAAILTAVHIGFDDSDGRVEIAKVRQAVAKAFTAQVPRGAIQPSPQLTSLRCPVCGDYLLRQTSRLICSSHQISMGIELTKSIDDYLDSAPSDVAVSSGIRPTRGAAFCPADGFLIRVADDGLPPCLSCRRALPDALVRLANQLPNHDP